MHKAQIAKSIGELIRMLSDEEAAAFFAFCYNAFLDDDYRTLSLRPSHRFVSFGVESPWSHVAHV